MRIGGILAVMLGASALTFAAPLQESNVDEVVPEAPEVDLMQPLLEFQELVQLEEEDTATASTCVDTDKQCQGWAYHGDCASNKAYMAKHCAKSCGCDGALCVDIYHSAQCARWATKGQCTSNPGFMRASCKKACNACSATKVSKAAVTKVVHAPTTVPATGANTASVTYHNIVSSNSSNPLAPVLRKETYTKYVPVTKEVTQYRNVTHNKVVPEYSTKVITNQVPETTTVVHHIPVNYTDKTVYRSHEEPVIKYKDEKTWTPVVTQKQVIKRVPYVAYKNVKTTVPVVTRKEVTRRVPYVAYKNVSTSRTERIPVTTITSKVTKMVPHTQKQRVVRYRDIKTEHTVEEQVPQTAEKKIVYSRVVVDKTATAERAIKVAQRQSQTVKSRVVNSGLTKWRVNGAGKVVSVGKSHVVGSSAVAGGAAVVANSTANSTVPFELEFVDN